MVSEATSVVNLRVSLVGVYELKLKKSWEWGCACFHLTQVSEFKSIARERITDCFNHEGHEEHEGSDWQSFHLIA